MRYSIPKIVLSSILLTCNSYSQFIADSSISEYVIDLFNSADSFYNFSLSQQDNNNDSDSLNLSLSVDQIARLYYKAFDEDPIGYNSYLEKLHSRWKSQPFVPQSKPALKIHRLKKKIAQKYGVPFTEIIGTPAFVKCKFINQTSSYYSNGILNSNFNFIIEDIIKGIKFFCVSDSITIKMIGNIESPCPIFERNKSYLIPIGTLYGYNQGSFNLVFQSLKDEYDVWKMGEPPRVFPIENETIKNCKYFGFSQMNWNEFKKYFREKFLIFE